MYRRMTTMLCTVGAPAAQVRRCGAGRLRGARGACLCALARPTASACRDRAILRRIRAWASLRTALRAPHAPHARILPTRAAGGVEKRGGCGRADGEVGWVGYGCRACDSFRVGVLETHLFIDHSLRRGLCVVHPGPPRHLPTSDYAPLPPSPHAFPGPRGDCFCGVRRASFSRRLVDCVCVVFAARS